MIARRALALIAILTAAGAWLGERTFAEAPVPAPEKRPIALVGALIRTQTDQGDFIGTILVREGKIEAIGPKVQIPDGALVHNLGGFVITPGLIDSHGVLSLNGLAARESGRDASLDIMDGVDPFDDDWQDVARQGVTAVYVQPAGSGQLGGAGAVLKVGPGMTAQDLALRHPAGVQAALGGVAPAAAAPAANPLAAILAQLGITLPQQPAQTTPSSNSLTRFAQYESLRASFDAAKRTTEGRANRSDVGRDLLKKAISREIPVHMEVGHEDDLANALKLANDFGLKIIFEHVDRVRVVPEEMKSSKAALVVGPLVGGKKSSDVRKLAIDGRRWAIGTFGDDSRSSAWLRAHAAAAVADGYPREQVLQALTSNAAELLGLGDKLGRLAAGRPADLAVFAGDPLDPSTAVRLTMSQGIVTHDAPKVEPAPIVSAANPTLPDKFPSAFVIRTKRLLGESGEFAPGDLFIENGKLTARSPNGDGTPVFDVGDAPVTPGLVAANVTISNEETPDADSSHMRAADGVPVDDAKLKSLRDAGFLTVVVAPGQRDVIGGIASSIPSGDTLAAEDCGLKFNLTNFARSNERYPVSLIGQVELINARLHGEPSTSELYLPPSMRKALYALRDRNIGYVKERKLPAYLEAHTNAEVRAAVQLAGENKLRGVIVQPRDVSNLGDEIKKAGLAVVVGPQSPRDLEKNRAGLVGLGQSGVPMSCGGSEAADLRMAAAWLTNGGLHRATARRALMSQPVATFGLPADTARLSPGDSADFVIWDGDPIDTGSRPIAVTVGGQRVSRGS